VGLGDGDFEEMKPLFFGIVKQGKLKFDVPDKFMVYLSGLEGKRFELTLEKERHARTLSQNAYYWGVVVEILRNYFGYESEEMHEALKFKFLKKFEDSDLVTVGSTTKLSTIEFGEYIDRIMEWAAKEYQVVIPTAGEYL
jgi:hypothetical protein